MSMLFSLSNFFQSYQKKKNVLSGFVLFTLNEKRHHIVNKSSSRRIIFKKNRNSFMFYPISNIFLKNIFKVYMNPYVNHFPTLYAC